MSKLGFIYKLTNGEQDYYGSTSMGLNLRMNCHRQPANYKKSISRILFEGDKPVIMKCIEVVYYDNISELTLKEAEYIENNECINKNNPNRTKSRKGFNSSEYSKQYYLDKRKDNDEVKQKRIDYEDKNRDNINKKQRARRKLKDMKEKINCSICGASVLKEGIYRHKKTKKCLSHITK